MWYNDSGFIVSNHNGRETGARRVLQGGYVILKKRPLVSVIVPVYNVEAYIRDCLASLVGQTYRNLEILVINDGSGDRSGAICDEIAGEDARIQVIHQENRGVSCARNTGLSLAKGEFIHFCDADDWMETDTYESLVPIMQNQNVDICGFPFIINNGKSPGYVQDCYLPTGRYNKIAYLKYAVGVISKANKLTTCRLCVTNKLFRASVFQNEDGTAVRFREDTVILEDGIFLLSTFIHWRQACFQDHGYYHRRIHAQSTMEETDTERLIEHLLNGFQQMLQIPSIRGNRVAYHYVYSAYSRVSLHYLVESTQEQREQTVAAILNRFCDDASFRVEAKKRFRRLGLPVS